MTTEPQPTVAQHHFQSVSKRTPLAETVSKSVSRHSFCLCVLPTPLFAQLAGHLLSITLINHSCGFAGWLSVICAPVFLLVVESQVVACSSQSTPAHLDYSHSGLCSSPHPLLPPDKLQSSHHSKNYNKSSSSSPDQSVSCAWGFSNFPQQKNNNNLLQSAF